MGGRWHIFVALIAASFAAEAGAAPSSATAVVPVRASVAKPLVLTSLQNLDFGTIVLRNGTWTGGIVSVSQAGVRTCINPNLTCTGTSQAARYRVIGTNKLTILIAAPIVALVNQSDSSRTLQLIPDRPATLILPTPAIRASSLLWAGRSLCLQAPRTGSTSAR